MKVAVLGAGLAGVSTAHALLEKGHDVLLLDRQPDVALETSRANGGQISASQPHPWAAPKALGHIFRFLSGGDSPLAFRPRLDRDLISWSWRFLANCTHARNRAGAERALRIALFSRECLGLLRERTGISYDEQTRGILKVLRSREGFEAACRESEWLTAHGVAQQPLDRARCVEIEPALSVAKDRIAGGIYTASDESGDAHRFVEQLAARVRQIGGEFRFDTNIQGIECERGRAAAVITDEGRIAADAIVLSLGSYAPAIGRTAGLRLPIYPVKGYSVTLPIGAEHSAPSISITDEERYVVVSRLGNRLRAAGTAEIAGFDQRIDRARAGRVLAALMELFPEGGDERRVSYWTGLRPMTPDGLPILGSSPVENLYLNCGHGTLGWTMACGSAQVVADIISGRSPPISLEGLTYDRFGRR